MRADNLSKTLAKLRNILLIYYQSPQGRPSGRPLRLGLVEFFRVFFCFVFLVSLLKSFLCIFFIILKRFILTVATFKKQLHRYSKLRIKFKHLLACGAFFWQINRKHCTFQKQFYDWSCTLSNAVEQFFCNFFLTAAPRHC